MRNFLAFLFFLFFKISASANSFNIYHCDFLKKDQQWINFGWGYMGYNTTLGWNQTAFVAKMALYGGNSGGLGVCSYISSTYPEDLNININFVVGEKLSLEGQDCSFSGKEVRIDQRYTPIFDKPMHFAAIKQFSMDGQFYEQLHIVGIRETANGDPAKVCAKIFKEVIGTESPEASEKRYTSSQGEIDKKMLPQTKYSTNF